MQQQQPHPSSALKVRQIIELTDSAILTYDENQFILDPMVAAAFDSLKDENTTIKPVDNLDEIDERIINAKSVMGLLSVAEGNTPVTRKHALKVV